MAIDYKLSETGDLEFENGDFKRTISDQQSAVLVLNTNKGSWKYHPFCGMGIRNYMGSSGTNLQMKREMIVQLQADGYIVNDIVIKNYDDFYLDIERKENGN